MATIQSKDKLVAVKAYARGNALPLDASSVFDSVEEAQNYAANDPTSYNLQIIGVMNGNKPEAYIVYDKALYPVGAVTNLVAADESEMLGYTDIDIGTTVFRTDVSKYYILVGNDPSDINNWRTEESEALFWGTIG